MTLHQQIIQQIQKCFCYHMILLSVIFAWAKLFLAICLLYNVQYIERQKDIRLGDLTFYRNYIEELISVKLCHHNLFLLVLQLPWAWIDSMHCHDFMFWVGYMNKHNNEFFTLKNLWHCCFCCSSIIFMISVKNWMTSLNFFWQN